MLKDATITRVLLRIAKALKFSVDRAADETKSIPLTPAAANAYIFSKCQKPKFRKLEQVTR